MSMRLSASALVLLAMANPVMAADNSGLFYVGASAGAVKYDIGDLESALDAAVALANATPGVTASSDADDIDMQFGVQLGYQFNRFVAMELGYRNYGEADANFSATDGIDRIVADNTLGASGFGISLIGFIPVGETFNVYGRLDAVNLRSNIKAMFVDTSSGTFIRASDTDAEMKLGFGLGMQWNFESCTSLRVEANHIEAELPTFATQDKWNMTGISIGLLKAF